MRIDRSHTPWILFVLASSAGALVLFLANFYPANLPFAFSLPAIFGPVPPVRATFGGTPLGLLFGSVSFLIFVFAAALGIRKKRRLWRIGSVQFWLKAHIWLTVLTLPLVAFHCGFRSGGTHTTWLMVLYGFVMGSGFFGLALQQFMPRLMKERLPREVVFEQIPHIRGRIFEAALELLHDVREASKALRKTDAAQPVAAVAAAAVAAVVAPAAVAVPDAQDQERALIVLGDFLEEECLPYLNSARGKGFKLANESVARDLFRLLRLRLTEKWHPQADEMEGWCEDRRLMDLQMSLHHWLHGWLLIHVPASFALLIWTAWHGWVAVRYLVVLP